MKINKKIGKSLDFENQSSPLNSILTKSSVVNTLTNDCCLRCGSLDQIEALRDNAAAIYGASSASGEALIDFLMKSLYSEYLKNLISSSTSACLISNSCSESFDLSKHSDLCLSNSNFMNSGAQTSALSEENRYESIEKGFISEKNILLSNTSHIFYNPNFAFCLGESSESNSSLSFGESSASNLLNLPFFAFLPNSTDHLINSCSSLDFNLFNNSSACFFRSSNLSLANSDQLTQTNLDILDLSSGSIANVTLAIYITPLDFNSSNFSSSSSFLIMPWRITSATFTSGNNFLNSANNSSGIDTVIRGIFLPPSIYVNTSKYVQIFKPFVFAKIVK